MISAHEEGQKNSTISATGFFISRDGLVLTSTIPVQEADRIFVELDSTNYFAELIGMDTTTRLAVLRVQEPPKDITFISTTEVLSIPASGSFLIPISRRLGQTPAPYLSSLLGETSPIGFLPTTFIRSNIQMAKGEPGAPVFDLNGRLVGVLVAYSEDVGESLIIPSHATNRIVEDLLNFGEVRYGWLGMNVDLQISLKQGQRLIIKEVLPDGPADVAGLQKNDRILSVAEQEIKSLKDMQEVMFFTRHGTMIPIVVSRGEPEQVFTLAVKVALRPEPEQEAVINVPAAESVEKMEDAPVPVPAQEKDSLSEE